MSVRDRGSRTMRFAGCCDRAGAGRRRRSGSRKISNGNADAAIATRNMNRPMARASGGNTNHRPAHEKARKSPTTVASAARAGHNRSQNILPRARVSARASRTRRRLPPAREAGRSLRPKAAPSLGLGRICCSPSNTHGPYRPTCRPRVYLCAQSQSGMRSSAINWSTSRRGRTSAHSRAVDQHFRHQGPRVVGAGLYRAIGARRHHGKQCTACRFHHIAVDGEEIAAFTHRPDHIGADTTRRGDGCVTGQIS